MLLMATQDRELIAFDLPFGPTIVRIVPVLWTSAIVLMCRTVTPCLVCMALVANCHAIASVLGCKGQILTLSSLPQLALPCGRAGNKCYLGSCSNNIPEILSDARLSSKTFTAALCATIQHQQRYLASWKEGTVSITTQVCFAAVLAT